MDVIDELIACCEAWEPEVCVMGNVRAGEAAKALRGLRADLTMAGAFHKAAVAQRNSAWEEIEHLRAELAECRDALAKIGPYYVPSTELSDDEVNAMYAMIDAACKGEGDA